ncbi:MAG: hypothetical protein KJ601_02065 [Nanoarchaeota archaeon]|nr:hypothetical protein [Nanoarchaeota archaeon]MBU1703770.1 hypothetical protein [Nanoarchaeota archaeon]
MLDDSLLLNWLVDEEESERRRASTRNGVRQAICDFLAQYIPNDYDRPVLEFASGEGKARMDLPAHLTQNLTVIEYPQFVKSDVAPIRYVKGDFRDVTAVFNRTLFGVAYAKDADWIPDTSTIARRAYGFLEPGGFFFHYKERLAECNAVKAMLMHDRCEVEFECDGFNIPRKAHVYPEGSPDKSYVVDIDGFWHNKLVGDLREAGFHDVQSLNAAATVQVEGNQSHPIPNNYFANWNGTLASGEFPSGSELGDLVFKDGMVIEDVSLSIVIARK